MAGEVESDLLLGDPEGLLGVLELPGLWLTPGEVEAEGLLLLLDAGVVLLLLSAEVELCGVLYEGEPGEGLPLRLLLPLEGEEALCAGL